MDTGNRNRHDRESGAALIGALVFLLILSTLLMGMGSFTAGHQQRAHVDADYAVAMDIAEAGANWEMSRISANKASADATPGNAYSFGGGTFKVWCTNRDGTTNWDKTNPLYVFSTGTFDGVSRTIRVSVLGNNTSTPADYAVFALNEGSANGNCTIGGDFGTNGAVTLNGNVKVNGNVSLNGATSKLNGGNNTGYNVVTSPNPVPWPTVSEIANGKFGANGLTWLATHNDNASNPNIINNKISMNGNKNTTFTGAPGGANYYLTSMNFNGNGGIILDNSLGPINIWLGPSGSAGDCTINGGVDAVTMNQNPNKACRLYCATKGEVKLNGNTNFHGGIYAYETDANGAFGTVTNNGTPNVYGSIMANKVTLNGNVNISYHSGYFQGNVSVTGYYGYDNSWQEQNAR